MDESSNLNENEEPGARLAEAERLVGHPGPWPTLASEFYPNISYKSAQ
jgi:hypothetical protein